MRIERIFEIVLDVRKADEDEREEDRHDEEQGDPELFGLIGEVWPVKERQQQDEKVAEGAKRPWRAILVDVLRIFERPDHPLEILIQAGAFGRGEAGGAHLFDEFGEAIKGFVRRFLMRRRILERPFEHVAKGGQQLTKSGLQLLVTFLVGIPQPVT